MDHLFEHNSDGQMAFTEQRMSYWVTVAISEAHEARCLALFLGVHTHSAKWKNGFFPGSV